MSEKDSEEIDNEGGFLIKRESQDLDNLAESNDNKNEGIFRACDPAGIKKKKLDFKINSLVKCKNPKELKTEYLVDLQRNMHSMITNLETMSSGLDQFIKAPGSEEQPEPTSVNLNPGITTNSSIFNTNYGDRNPWMG